jgi:hypothetical protein
MWENDIGWSRCVAGLEAFKSLVERRFSQEGLCRFFGPDPWARAARYIELCGGHFRDLMLLLRETIVRAQELPVADGAMEEAILGVKSNFLPIAIDDAKWLAAIERERASLLKSSTDAAEINRLTKFLDTHVVLYLKNGEEWYDVHPLIRKEVVAIAQAAAAAEAS